MLRPVVRVAGVNGLGNVCARGSNDTTRPFPRPCGLARNPLTR
jgi:hypothetical protein